MSVFPCEDVEMEPSNLLNRISLILDERFAALYASSIMSASPADNVLVRRSIRRRTANSATSKFDEQDDKAQQVVTDGAGGPSGKKRKLAAIDPASDGNTNQQSASIETEGGTNIMREDTVKNGTDKTPIWHATDEYTDLMTTINAHASSASSFQEKLFRMVNLPLKVAELAQKGYACFMGQAQETGEKMDSLLEFTHDTWNHAHHLHEYHKRATELAAGRVIMLEKQLKMAENQLKLAKEELSACQVAEAVSKTILQKTLDTEKQTAVIKHTANHALEASNHCQPLRLVEKIGEATTAMSKAEGLGDLADAFNKERAEKFGVNKSMEAHYEPTRPGGDIPGTPDKVPRPLSVNPNYSPHVNLNITKVNFGLPAVADTGEHNWSEGGDDADLAFW